MAYAQIFNAAATGTTTGVDTSGATLIVLFVCQDSLAQTVSDSKSNTWTSLTGQAGGAGNTAGRFWYAVSPTVGSSHTFSAGVSYGAIVAVGYSGNHASAPFDQENGAGDTNPWINRSTGSVTPSEDNELVLAAVGVSDTTSGFASDGGFSLVASKDSVSGVTYWGAIFELIQTTAAAANPSLSWSFIAHNYTVIATFKVAAAAGIAIPVLTRQYRERWS